MNAKMQHYSLNIACHSGLLITIFRVHLIECVVDLVKETITDSSKVKEIKMHKDKRFYLLSEAIGPNIKENVVTCMKKYPYSLNYNESVVNKKSQLALNASFRNEQNLIQKANIGSIQITSGGSVLCTSTFSETSI